MLCSGAGPTVDSAPASSELPGTWKANRGPSVACRGSRSRALKTTRSSISDWVPSGEEGVVGY